MADNSNSNQGSGENASKQEKAGQETVQKALDASKKALIHAVSALKTLVMDPMQGQSKALSELSEANAFAAGIVFIAVYLIAALIGSRVFLGPLRYWGGGLSFGWYVKLFISSLIPIVGLFVGYLLIDKALGKKNTNWMVYVFTTGVTVLPMAIVFLVFWFPYQAIMAIGAFCLSIMVLLVYSALSNVYTLSSQMAFWLTPVLFLVVAFISRVLFSRII
jgi:hypothetical protein